MSDPERKEPPSPDSDIDPAWRAHPAEPATPPPAAPPPAAAAATPPPATPTPPPAAPALPPTAAPDARAAAPDARAAAPARPTPTPTPEIPQLSPHGRALAPPEPEPEEEVETEPAAPGEAEAAAEETVDAPPAGLAPGTTAAILLALLLGAALAWRLTAPSRAFNRGEALLYKAKRANDPRAAAEALQVFESYVDATGRGYDRLFEAASLAGDEAAGARYEERLMKSPPETGSALLVWYESALTYHALAARAGLAALDAADPAARQALAEKVRAHLDAATALKPARAKAVDAFENGFTGPDAAILLRIDAMQRELDETAAPKLSALAPPAVSTAAPAAATPPASP